MKVGITGSIGSGKSTVCRLFELLGIPIYYADDRAKILMVENQSLKEEINTLFDGKAYQKNGSLDRKYVASIVFQNRDKLQALNAIVHPQVALDAKAWHAKQKSPYTIKEAALLIESNSHLDMQKIIVVDAPLKVRIARVMARDKTTESAVMSRENKQLNPQVKLNHADFKIINYKTDLVNQVLTIHRKLLNLLT